MTRIGVVVFPGSNCDRDTLHAVELAGAEAVELWHESPTLDGADAVILPGGFAYGDYLRAGVIARFSPVMRAVADFAANGGLVLGICNGFQVLAEAGLVPGALLRNRDLRFLGRDVRIVAERTDTPFTRGLERGRPMRLPIAHGEGCYFADNATLDALERDGQVLFRYATTDGERAADGDRASNPNGSLRAIAGVLNAAGNVAGLMPHPERASEAILGSTDGFGIIRSLVTAAAQRAGTPVLVGGGS
jgi:phosphoribosylformylglycinamidine synthase